jgi:hypothetical protein
MKIPNTIVLITKVLMLYIRSLNLYILYICYLNPFSSPHALIPCGTDLFSIFVYLAFFDRNSFQHQNSFPKLGAVSHTCNPSILNTWEADIGRIMIQGQLRQKKSLWNTISMMKVGCCDTCLSSQWHWEVQNRMITVLTSLGKKWTLSSKQQ